MVRCCAVVVLILRAGTCSIAAAQNPDDSREPVAITNRRTAVEERIYRTLEDRTECDFTDTPLVNVVDHFRSTHQIDIQLDNKSLQDEAVDTSAPITRHLKGVKLKSGLRTILRDLNLTFIVQNEALWITTLTTADAVSEIRTYPVSDLLGGRPDSPNYASLIIIITSTVEPATWDENGGPGSIQPFHQNKLLVVAQTQQVHEELAELLRQLRQASPRETGNRRASALRPSNRNAEPDRHYVADPQLLHIVGRLYPGNDGTAQTGD